MTFQICDLTFRIDDLTFRIDDLTFWIGDLTFQICDLTFRIDDLGFWIDDLTFQIIGNQKNLRVYGIYGVLITFTPPVAGQVCRKHDQQGRKQLSVR